MKYLSILLSCLCTITPLVAETLTITCFDPSFYDDFKPSQFIDYSDNNKQKNDAPILSYISSNPQPSHAEQNFHHARNVVEWLRQDNRNRPYHEPIYDLYHHPCCASAAGAYGCILAQYGTTDFKKGSLWDPYYKRYIRPNDIQHLFNYLDFYNYPEIIVAFRRLPGFTKNLEKIFYRLMRRESSLTDLSSKARENISDAYISILESQNNLFSKRYREDEAADLAMYAEMYQEIIDTINPYGSNTWRTKSRIDAIREMELGKITYEYKSYMFSPEVEDLLAKESIDIPMFRFCYGNQLQQLLHREIISLLEAWGRVKKGDEQYDYQSTIAAGAEVSRTYNHAGSMKKAMAVLDFCWGLTAACVGGAINAGYQMIANPVATIAGISGRNYMLYFNTALLLYDVCEIGYIALSDPKKAKAELEQRYVQPVEQMIDAITKSEKGMVRATLEMGVACVSEYYTRKYLLGKLGKFYSKAKDRISSAIKKFKNGYEKVYATTPEGAIIESSKQFIEQEQIKRSHFDAMNTQKPGGKFDITSLRTKEVSDEVTRIANEKLQSLVKDGSFIKKIDPRAFKYEHLFSDDHVEKGILHLGNGPSDITSKMVDVIMKADKNSLLRNGATRIWTTINDCNVEIRTYVKDNILMSFNGFIEYSSRLNPAPIIIP